MTPDEREACCQIVRPATLLAWFRQLAARKYDGSKARRAGRPRKAADLRELVLEPLIERMARDNPLWSRRRIASELAKLGHDVSKETVAKYLLKASKRPRRPPTTTWRAFVRADLAGTIAIDFLVVPTVTFQLLYVFFVLSLERRQLLHVNVTSHPYAEWTGQQIVEAVGFDAGTEMRSTAPRSMRASTVWAWCK